MTWTSVASNTATFADGSTGHVYSPPAGAPSAGQLDVLCVNSDTTVSTPVTSGGAAWTLGPTFVGNQGSYIWYRVATGGEGATITITTSGNFPTQVSFSRWSAGTITADVNAVAHVDGVSGHTTPAVTTPGLAATGELSVGFGAASNMEAGTITSPVWSSGYTGLTLDQSGTGTTDVSGMVGYNNNAGTAAESPNVTWAGTNTINQYILVQTFKTTATAAAAGSVSDLSDQRHRFFKKLRYL